MNKAFSRISILGAALAVLALAAFSCTRVEADLRAPVGDEITLSVGFEEQTDATGGQTPKVDSKTYVSGNSIRWGSGSNDKILYVFDSKGGKNSFTSSSTKAEAVRSFTGTITEGSTIKYVLWTGKASGDQTSLSGDVIDGSTLVVPSTQAINNSSSFNQYCNYSVMKPGDKQDHSKPHP